MEKVKEVGTRTRMVRSCGRMTWMGVRLRTTRMCRTNVITTFQAENLKAEMHPFQVGNLDDITPCYTCTGYRQQYNCNCTN